MVYREPADELARRAAAAKENAGPLASIEVDGRPGRHGADGARGRDGHGDGRGGQVGGNAGEAERGEGGGTIDVTLASLPGRPDMALLRGAGIDQEIDFSRSGDIVLSARGGAGGPGGGGGRGGDGARGRAGANATSTSYGGDGGPGGNGGDAGTGSSGAEGGRGGAIVVRVREEDAHLLMLVAADIGGGRGGKPGDNGVPGRGGEGGPGGSSYTWTTTMTTSDGQGNTSTVTYSHVNRGGSRGRTGQPGRASNVVPQPGRRGANGAFAIESGAARYPARYDLQLVSFRHRNANDDGIYEPEEQVFVDQIEVANIGGMPTPAHHDLRVGLQDLGWVAPADATVTLPRRLAPGQRCVLDASLALELRVYRPQVSGAPLAADETIRFFADLPDVRRRFGNFETSTTEAIGRLVVRFPVEASPLTSLFSLAPGRAARVRWSITNVSKKAFGLASIEKRAVSVYFGLARARARGEGDLDASKIHFFDEHGTRIPLDTGFRRALPSIAPNETITFEGTLAVDDAAESYASARLFLAAELGHIAEPGTVRPVQYQEVTLRVGRAFEARDADILFVTNNRTTQAELEAWEALATQSGLSSAVWDAYLEGGLGILDDVVAEKRRYALVVVLNNPMDLPAGEHRASVLLDQATSLALASRDVHVLYVGRAPDLGALVVPIDDPTQESAEDAVVAACEREAVAGAGITVPVHTTYTWPWSRPREQELTRRAFALSARLEQRWPERRYVIVSRWEPALVKSVAWVRTFRLGHLEVRRSLDASRAAVTGLEVDAKSMHDARFIAEAAVHGYLLSALPFDAKLALLERSPAPIGASDSDPLVAALVTDLVREQAQVARYGWRVSRASLAQALPMLDALTKHVPGNARVIELAAWLDLVARDHARLWEWLPPLVWLRRGPGLRAFVRRALHDWLARAGVSREAVAARRKELAASWKMKLAAAPTLPSDADHLPVGARVIDDATHAVMREKERGRSERAAEVVAGAGRARSDLLRTESCAELLTGAGVLEARVAVPTRVANDEREPEAEDTEATADDLRDLLRR